MDFLILSEVSATHSESCGPSLKGKSFKHREFFHSMLTAYFELNKGFTNPLFIHSDPSKLFSSVTCDTTNHY